MAKGFLILAGLGVLGVAVLGMFYVASKPPLAEAPVPVPVVAAVIAVPAETTVAEISDAPRLVIEVAGSTEGRIVIELLPDVAPGHVERVTGLAAQGAYDGVVFHRVIDGFMAQTGDVEFGRLGGALAQAGSGASDLPDLTAEFNATSFLRGTVGMARSSSPDSGNSQFFIMFAPAPHLNGQYTVFGQVVEGMDVVDALRKGDGGRNGTVTDPDYMSVVTVAE